MEKIEFKPLHSAENYHTWRWRVEAILIEKELKPHLERQLTHRVENLNTPIPIGPANRIISVIINRISDNVTEKLHGLEAAGNIWNTLEQHYKINDREQQLKSLKAIENPPGKTLTERLTNFELHVRRFENSGGTIGEIQKVEKALNIVDTPGSKLLNLAIDTSPEKFSFGIVVKTLFLISEEFDRTRSGPRGRYVQNELRGQHRQLPRAGGLKCKHCGQVGHVRAQCVKLVCGNCERNGHATKGCWSEKETVKQEARMGTIDNVMDLLDLNDGFSQTSGATDKSEILNRMNGFMAGHVDLTEKRNKNEKTEKQNKKEKNLKN
eukprot:snap_masked-scaffold_26-processed-gene-4.55-mRNA-1 protein AED:1.00 eAED:1.00 QI:0/0/0/0/1/1/2/0/322